MNIAILKNSFRNIKMAPLLFSAFILSWLYWGYLFSGTSMVIAHDSLDYEELGRILSEGGLGNFFATGLRREILYPFVISLAMRAGRLLSLPYSVPLKILQILFLLMAQILTFRLLKKLRIRQGLQALTLLYLGFSPGIVNSAFSLYSEIIVYPIILAIVLTAPPAWKMLCANGTSRGHVLIRAMASGILFVLATFVKGVFEILAFASLLPVIFLALRFYRRHEKRLFKNALIFIIGFLVAFSVPVNAYKFANKIFNQQFVLTNRGAWALYGNIARRHEPLNRKRLLAALASVPGERACLSLADEASCQFWTAQMSDSIAFTKLSDLGASGFSPPQVNRILLRLSVKQLLEKPFQQSFFLVLEGLKMFFWESTKIGYVTYPAWLQKLYDFTPFKNGLRLLLAVMSFLAFVYLLLFLWRHRRDVLRGNNDGGEETVFLFSVFWLIFPFIGLHSFFFILTRYALPISPLYLALVAFWIQEIFFRRKTSDSARKP